MVPREEQKLAFYGPALVAPKGRDPGREAGLEPEVGPPWAGPTQQTQERPPLNWCKPGAAGEP